MDKITINRVAFHGHVHEKIQGGQKQHCADLGMSRDTLRKKLEGEISFKFSDINRLASALEINASDLISFKNGTG